MSSLISIPILFLAVGLLKVHSLQIEPIDKFQVANEKILSEDNKFFKQTPSKRDLQSISLNIQNKTAITKEIIGILNGLRSKSGKSQLGQNQQIQQIISRWATIFKQLYSLEEYLYRLGKFSGSLILKFQNFGSKENLLKTIQQKSNQFIGLQRLTQIGIFVQIVEQKFNVYILVKDFNVKGSQIQVRKFEDDKSSGVKLADAQVIGNLSFLNLTAKNDTNAEGNISEIKNSTPVAPGKKLLAYSQPNGILFNSSLNGGNLVQNSTIILPSPKLPSNVFQNTKISNSIFKGMILYHELPKNFSNTEKFMVKGRLLTPPQTDDGLLVMIFFRPINSQNVTRFMKWIPKGQSEVEVLLEMNKLKQGQYQLSANVGSVFTQQQIYTVKSVGSLNLQQQNAPLAPSNLSISFTDNKLYFQWEENNKAALIKISFEQGSIKRQYILSNFPTKFEVAFKDFYNFNSDPVAVSISSAYSSSPSEIERISPYSLPTTLKFNPIGHHFSETDDKGIQLDMQIPERIKVGESITISGKALVELSNKIVVEQPSKTFGEYYFNEQNKSEVLPVGRVLLKKLTFTQTGVYIIEVNNAPGSAVINRPVYVGEGYPLLPDFEDLRGEMMELSEIAKTQPSSIVEQRSLLLSLINVKREQFGVKPVTSDPQLDQLAQYHTDDMIARNFFGHINPSKQTPQDRATKFGITQGVAENIAMNINLTDAHYRLCRSPSHLMNVVNKEWEKVGLGVSRNSEQYFYVAQEFAGRDYIKNPLTEEEINIYKNELISYIKELYPTVKTENLKLSSGLSEWQNLPAQTQNSQSIMSFLRSKGLKNFSIGNIRLYFRQNFVDNMKKSGYLETDKPNPTQVGLGMKMDNGWLEIFVGYV